MKIKIPEKAVMKAVADYLSVLEKTGKVVWWTRHNSGIIFGTGSRGRSVTRLGKRGDPDYIGCYGDGRLFAIECKGSSGKLSPEQADTLNKIKIAGGIGIVAYSVDDVEDILR